jgi:hypothetical protein
MKRMTVVAVAIMLVATLVYWGHPDKKTSVPELAQASTPSQSTSDQIPEVIQRPPMGIPEEYIPFTPGLRLEYRITLGPAEPLNFGVTVWSMGNGHGILSETRGRFAPPTKRTYSLILQIAGPVTKEGPYSWDGVKVKDEIGVFEGAQELFWSRAPGDDFNVLEVRTYSPDSTGAPMGSWGVPESEGGSASRIIFFGGPPGSARGIGPRDSEDKIGFLGSEGDTLHFVRQVKTHESDPSESEDAKLLDQGFEEHTWFERGRGMVRLEQRINGATSMRWQLVGSNTFSGTPSDVVLQ